MLTPEQKIRYAEDGFLILPDFKSKAEIAALRARAEAIVDAFDPADSRTIFTTNEQARKVADYIAGMTDRYAMREYRRLFAVDEI